MEELISRITTNVGIDSDTATKSVGMILGFLKSEGPTDKVEAMLGEIPGAEDAIENAGGKGMLSSLMGGGVMGLGTQLMGAGLGMGEISGVAKETISFAKEKSDPAKVDDIIASIPGLSQFV